MILAHHMGEEALPTLIAAGAGVAPVFLAVARARLAHIGKKLLRR